MVLVLLLCSTFVTWVAIDELGAASKRRHLLRAAEIQIRAVEAAKEKRCPSESNQ